MKGIPFPKPDGSKVMMQVRQQQQQTDLINKIY